MRYIQIIKGGLLALWTLSLSAEPMSFIQEIDIKEKISSKNSSYIKIDCQGEKAQKWRFKINTKTKRMWIKLKTMHPYSIPITYSQWDSPSRKKIVVIAGKNKKYVKATIKRNHVCHLDFSRLNYTYSITAKMARIGNISGCCNDMNH